MHYFDFPFEERTIFLLIIFTFVVMKKSFAIIFIAVYLFSTTEISQLLRIGSLIEHYCEHKGNNRSMTFLNFLAIHYNNHLENHPHDEDYEKDKKLPFVTHTDVLNFYFTPLQSAPIEVREKSIPTRSDKKLATNDHFAGANPLSAIWQPPKFC